MSSIVLFGAGSPILGDVEETCLRLGLSVAAIVRNIGSATQQDTIGPTISLEELTPRLLALPMAFPLFSPATRRFAWSHASALGAARFDPLIDPTAILPSRMTVEEGVYINSGAVFGAFSRLGRAVFINRAAVIGHHVELDEFVSVGPGAKIGSNVRVGRGTVLGGGAVILPGLAISENVIVAAGAVVTRDVPPNRVVMMGNPARVVAVQRMSGTRGE